MLRSSRRVGFGESLPRHQFPDFLLRNGYKRSRFSYLVDHFSANFTITHTGFRQPTRYCCL